jgi:hypothetical protein
MGERFLLSAQRSALCSGAHAQREKWGRNPELLPVEHDSNLFA